MPITQSRMTNLIKIARTYSDLLRETRAFAQDLFYEGSEEAGLVVEFIDKAMPPPEFQETLTREEYHYKLHGKENERNRQRMRELRAEARGERVSLQTALRQRRARAPETNPRKEKLEFGVDVHYAEDDAPLAPSLGLEDGPSNAPDFSPRAAPGPTPGTTLDAQSLAVRIEKEREELAALAGEGEDIV